MPWFFRGLAGFKYLPSLLIIEINIAAEFELLVLVGGDVLGLGFGR